MEMVENICQILATEALQSMIPVGQHLTNQMLGWLSIDFGNDIGNGEETLPGSDNWSTLYLEVDEVDAGN